LHRNALDRLTQLQATTRQRAPPVEVLEAAATPHAPWRPDYQTDAIVSLAGSLVFGLFAVLFAEFIAGPRPSPGMTVRHTWVPSALGYDRLEPPEPALAAPPRQRELAASPHLVELPAPELRELVDTEIAAMIAAGEHARIACVALLMGLTADELVSLRWDAVDLGGNIIRVPGTSARKFVLEEPLRGLVVARAKTLARPEATGSLLHDGAGAPLAVDEVAKLVLYAAYDARIERPHEITPAVLRHTYLAFLLRQGMRMSDISQIAGHIPHSELVAYAQIARSSVRLPFEQIERILPALRGSA
jgi:integrase